MADYDPKIIPTLDGIIEDDDDEVKETIIDLSSLLTHDDDDDDNFDLFAAEVKPDTGGTVTEDDSPQIGTIDTIETTESIDIGSELSATTIDIEVDIEASSSDDIAIDIDSNIESSSENTFADPEAFEIAEIETGAIEIDVMAIDEVETAIIVTEDAETDAYADEKDILELSDDEATGSALIDYHAEEETDIVIDTHQISADNSPDHSESETDSEIEPENYAPAEETSTELFTDGIPEITTEQDDDMDSAIVESAIIESNPESENDTEVSPTTDHVTAEILPTSVLSSISLEDLSENIVQQLMPELETQLRFMVLKTLHEKLPAEITRQLSPNRVRDGDE